MGTSRSVAMAFVLKHHEGLDALAAAHDGNSQETLDMLSGWADRIIVMEPKFALGILKKDIHKLVPPELTNVGMDRWMNPLHPELQEKVFEIMERLKSSGIIHP